MIVNPERDQAENLAICRCVVMDRGHHDDDEGSRQQGQHLHNREDGIDDWLSEAVDCEAHRECDKIRHTDEDFRSGVAAGQVQGTCVAQKVLGLKFRR